MSSPLVLQLNQKPVLVVGGGPVAERKVDYLLKQNAKVTLISPTLTDKLQTLDNNISVKQSSLTVEDVSVEFCSRLSVNWRSFFLIVVATDSFRTNEQLSRNLFQFVSLINIVDNPALSSFYFPAVLDRGALKISVSTSGKSPILAKKIRDYLFSTFGPEYDAYLDELYYVRSELLKIEPNPAKRKQMLEERTAFPIPEGTQSPPSPTKNYKKAK